MSADTNNPNLNQPSASGHPRDPTLADIDAERVDHLLIVKAFADGLELVETLNRLVPTQMAVKPGVIVLGLVLDTLTGRSPLYRLEELLEGRDTELPLRERAPESVLRRAHSTTTRWAGRWTSFMRREPGRSFPSWP